MKEYKPILVCYFKVESLKHYSTVSEVMTDLANKSGYELLLLFGVSDEKYARVEIISVDKATIVEDIQKYIDLQSIKEKE